MIIKRKYFFLLLFLMVVAPILAVRAFWIITAKTTNGVMAFQGKDISSQLQSSYSVMMFSTTGKDTVFFNTKDNEIYVPGETMSILYQPHQPTDAKVNTFLGLWVDTLFFAGIFFLFILIVFLHPGIVPYRSDIHLLAKKPFIKVV